MADVTERIAWCCIGIGIFMTIFVSVWTGTGVLTAFTDLQAPDDIAGLFGWIGAFVVDLMQVIFGFLNQSWASSFHPALRYAILLFFDMSLLFLVSSNTALLIVSGIAALIAGIASIFP